MLIIKPHKRIRCIKENPSVIKYAPEMFLFIEKFIGDLTLSLDSKEFLAAKRIYDRIIEEDSK